MIWKLNVRIQSRIIRECIHSCLEILTLTCNYRLLSLQAILIHESSFRSVIRNSTPYIIPSSIPNFQSQAEHRHKTTYIVLRTSHIIPLIFLFIPFWYPHPFLPLSFLSPRTYLFPTGIFNKITFVCRFSNHPQALRCEKRRN